jgi:4-aminobutyrate aminotransferase-like enzyme
MVSAILTKDVETADNIVLKARENGLLLVHTGKPSVKIGPPLTIPDDVLLEGLEILREVLSETS